MKRTELLVEIFEGLPKTSRSLWHKHHNQCPMFNHRGAEVVLRNDTGAMHDFRCLVNGVDIGLIRYWRGRKLVSLVKEGGEIL